MLIFICVFTLQVPNTVTAQNSNEQQVIIETGLKLADLNNYLPENWKEKIKLTYLKIDEAPEQPFKLLGKKVLPYTNELPNQSGNVMVLRITEMKIGVANCYLEFDLIYKSGEKTTAVQSVLLFEKQQDTWVIINKSITPTATASL